MNKKIILLIALLLVGAATLGIVLVLHYKDSQELDGYDQAAISLDRDYNADIMVYGNAPKFRDTVKYRTIHSLSSEEFEKNPDAGYEGLIIWDMDGKLTISDEEWLLIKEYVEDKGYDMFYLGSSKLDDLVRLGFTRGCDEGEESLEYIGSIFKGKEVQDNATGNLHAAHGLWTQDDHGKYINGDTEGVQLVILTFMHDYASGEITADDF